MDKSRGQLRPKNSENSDQLVVFEETDFLESGSLDSLQASDALEVDPVGSPGEDIFLGGRRASSREDTREDTGHRSEVLPLYYRLSSYLLIGALFISPFLFGGRSDISASSIRAVFFSYFAARFFYRLFVGKSNSGNQSKTEKISLLNSFYPSRASYACFTLVLPFLCYLLFQIVPLPYSIISVLSPDVAEAYLQAGVFSADLKGFAPLSLEPAASMDGLLWVLLFSLLGSEFLGLSFQLKEVSYSPRNSTSKSRSRSKRNSAKSVDFGASYRLFDKFAETLHRSLMYLGVLLSLVAVGHLSVGAEMLFGYFSPDVRFQGHSRAHWPFVSPNHLATILSVSLVLIFVGILRERQLRALRVEARRDDDSPVKAVIKVVSEWEQQGMQLFMFFVVLLGLLLTGSRAAIFISMCGISCLWIAYRLDRVTLVAKRRISHSQKSSSGHRRRGGSGETSSRAFSILKALVFPVMLLLLGLFFLGDSARNQLASRVEDGIQRGLDDGRRELNTISFQVFQQNVFWGVGLNAWRRAATEYTSPSLSQFDLDYAHNELLQFLCEVGVLGLATLVFPSIYALIRMRKKAKEEGAPGILYLLKNLAPLQRFYLLGALVAALLPFLHGLVDFPFHMPAVVLAVFASVILFLRNIMSVLQRERDSEERSLLH